MAARRQYVTPSALAGAAPPPAASAPYGAVPLFAPAQAPLTAPAPAPAAGAPLYTPAAGAPLYAPAIAAPSPAYVAPYTAPQTQTYVNPTLPPAYGVPAPSAIPPPTAKLAPGPPQLGPPPIGPPPVGPSAPPPAAPGAPAPAPEEGGDMEGGDGPVAASLNKLSLDPSKRAYPQAMYGVAGAAPGTTPGATPTGGYTPYSAPLQPPTGATANAALPRPAATTAAAFRPNMAAQCPPKYLRPSVAAVPASFQLQARSGLTFGCVVHPLAPPSPDEQLPVINYGAMSIIRCRRCRTYINAFVAFTDGGRRWRCNLCDMPNEVPVEYFSPLDSEGRRADHNERPELSRGCVEYVAPAEYMVRPPQPPAYVFVIDVSYYAVASGMLASLSAALLAALDKLPADPRTQIAFITFDTAVHFYKIRPGLSQPHMFVVPELEGGYIPPAEDFLVNVHEARDVVTALLTKLPLMFAATKTVDSATGPALKAAFALLKAMGGKLLLFQCAMPTLGAGKTRNRDDPKVLGSDKEATLLNPEDAFWKNYALDCSRNQIGVDTFVFASTPYQDVPSLGALSQISAGQLHYYAVGMMDDGDRAKFGRDVVHTLTRHTGFEAVMRVRCSKGVTVAAHYGNFFIRSTDLLALPNVDSDKAFGVTFNVSDNLAATPFVCVQAALLYTTSARERRIRVMTACLPVASQLGDLFKAADCEAQLYLTAQAAIERALTSRLSEARDLVLARCVDALATYRSSFAASTASSQLVLPDTLKLLPLYTLALLKHTALRPGGDVRPAERCAAMSLLRTLPVTHFVASVYPRLFALHAMPPEAGTGSPLVLPPVLNLSSEKFDRRGAFLLADGQALQLWVGRQTPPELLSELLGVPALDQLDPRAAQLNATSELGARVAAIVEYVRAQMLSYQRLYVIREGDPLEARFVGCFVEDRSKTQASSYYEFLLTLQKEVATKAAQAQGAK